MPLTHPHPMLTQHFSSIDIALAEIDAEITYLQDSLLALRKYRNSFTPVYRLTPEILTRIFTFLRFRDHSSDDAFYFKMFRRPPPKWTAMTYVSHRWRNIALGSPVLWSHIGMERGRVVEEWLKRSKSLPLSIDYYGRSLKDVEYVGTTLSRIRELRLEMPGSTTWNELSELLGSPAPALESLCIQITNPVQPAFNEFYPVQRLQPATIISDDTFAHATPRLRELRLINCSIDIKASLLKDLTVLELNDPPQKLSSKDVFNVLCNCPRLTTIILYHVLDLNSPLLDSDHTIGRLTLPFLDFFAIRGQIYVQELDFLSHITFPRTAAIHLYSGTLTGDSASVLEDFLATYDSCCLLEFPIDFDKVKTHLELNLLGFINLHMHSKHKETSVKMGYIDLEVDLPDDSLSILEESEVAWGLKTLPLESVTSFETSCEMSVGAWKDIFGDLAELESVVVSGRYAVNFLDAIVDDFKTHANEGGVTVGWVPVFPGLKSIEMKMATFPENPRALIDALRARKQVRTGVKEFDITECECKGMKGLVKSLRDVVETVRWDGEAYVDETGSGGDAV